MKSNRKFGHEGSTEYCGGFVDKHGIWNNGFHCPKWGNPGDEYCCGTDRHRYCCPQVDTSDSDNHKFKGHHIGILVGVLLVLVLIIFLVVVTICYFCKCCFFSKRRKRPHVCGAIPLTLRTSYPPSESPPPYPGGFEGSGEEKVPLSESQFVNGDPEDSPQRLQMSPLLSSPSDGSLTACQARLPDYDDDCVPWSGLGNRSRGSEHNNPYAKHGVQLNQATANNELSMQSFPIDKRRKSPASARESNGAIPRPHTLDREVRGLPREISPSDTLLFQGGNNLNLSTDNIRQNCHNEQRQLYNMVIVGVEPDLPAASPL